MTFAEWQRFCETRGVDQKDHEWVRPITDRIERSRIVDSREQTSTARIDAYQAEARRRSK